jgi:hypothetical protein
MATEEPGDFTSQYRNGNTLFILKSHLKVDCIANCNLDMMDKFLMLGEGKNQQFSGRM